MLLTLRQVANVKTCDFESGLEIGLYFYVTFNFVLKTCRVGVLYYFFFGNRSSILFLNMGYVKLGD